MKVHHCTVGNMSNLKMALLLRKFYVIWENRYWDRKYFVNDHVKFSFIHDIRMGCKVYRVYSFLPYCKCMFNNHILQNGMSEIFPYRRCRYCIWVQVFVVILQRYCFLSTKNWIVSAICYSDNLPYSNEHWEFFLAQVHNRVSVYMSCSSAQ